MSSSTPEATKGRSTADPVPIGSSIKRGPVCCSGALAVIAFGGARAPKLCWAAPALTSSTAANRQSQTVASAARAGTA